MRTWVTVRQVTSKVTNISLPCGGKLDRESSLSNNPYSEYDSSWCDAPYSPVPPLTQYITAMLFQQTKHAVPYTIAWMYVCMYVRTYVCMCVCMYVCKYVCMYVRMYEHVCMCVCMYVCKHVRTYVGTCVLTYACMYVYMYVCTYVCMYVCIMILNLSNTFIPWRRKPLKYFRLQQWYSKKTPNICLIVGYKTLHKIRRSNKLKLPVFA